MKPQHYDDLLAISEFFWRRDSPEAFFDLALNEDSAYIPIGVTSAMLRVICHFSLHNQLYVRSRGEFELWRPTRRTGI